ncbi:hypothetical protein HHI36_014147 [Cryptolaemus montrouzieri]|uniref:Helix-turn-helix domain-containing protein n=1 Tax=Cryptolaemus montrouzieri TaxID=559131 RepID=A0ABD2N1X0_9CUCU
MLLKIKFNVTFFKRFMDGCITCIPNDKINEMTEMFNSYHNKIQFTNEIEKDRTLNFLDMQIKHEQNDSILTNRYQKPTSTRRYLNYKSSVPNRYKKSMINGLVDRAMNLFIQNIEKTMKYIKNMLGKNAYPKTYYKPLIKKRIHQIYNSGEKTKNNGEFK